MVNQRLFSFSLPSSPAHRMSLSTRGSPMSIANLLCDPLPKSSLAHKEEEEDTRERKRQKKEEPSPLQSSQDVVSHVPSSSPSPRSHAATTLFQVNESGPLSKSPRGLRRLSFFFFFSFLSLFFPLPAQGISWALSGA